MESIGRILAIDWGRRRIGLALSDELGLTVRGLPTLERKNKATDLEAIERIVSENDVRLLVVGAPLHLDGSAGKSVGQAEQFGRTVAKRCRVPLELFDERLTSVEAESRLRERGGRRRSKADVDRVAAALILEGYLAQRAQHAEEAV